MQTKLSRFWETVVNTIQDGVMTVTPEGRIDTVNEAMASITGYTHEELLGASCTILGCPTCAQVRDKSAGEHWCSLFSQGSLRGQQCSIRRKDGRTISVMKNASVLHDADGTLLGAVETLTDLSTLLEQERQIATFRQELTAQDAFYGQVGQCALMQQVFALIEGVARADAPVIIYGESGTGKELVARAIHEAGPRRDKPFIKINCAALNASLLESELFGHVKGAYTGAHRTRIGRFESAADGDIFLDEIGDLPLDIQVKLLRVLEEKVLERVGEHVPIPIRARIITATNRNLPAFVAKEQFRQDLYYRINVLPVRLPPLRERGEDIALLAAAFFRRIQLKSGKAVHGVSREAMDALRAYSWPGNIRELRSTFEYAFVACQSSLIELADLPPEISRFEGSPIQHQANTLGQDLQSLKKNRLLEALTRTGWNQSAAARLLGISRTSVWNQIKRFELDARR